MFQIILLILLALAYFFLMPKDIRRSLDVFVISAFLVILVGLIIGFFLNQMQLLFNILMFVLAIGLTVKCIMEIEKLR